MLTELTKQQEKLMYEVHDEWLDWIFSCKTKLNKTKATKFVEWIYKLNDLQKPKIIFAESPLDCQFAAYLQLIKNTSTLKFYNQLRTKVIPQIKHRLSNWFDFQVKMPDLKEIWLDFNNKLHYMDRCLLLPNPYVQDQSVIYLLETIHKIDQVVSFSDNLFRKIPHLLFDINCEIVLNHTKYELHDQMQVFDNIDEQVKNLVNEVNMHYFDFSDYKYELKNIAFWDFFVRIGEIKNKDFCRYKKFLTESGIYDMIQFTNLCIVCDRPFKIKRDEQNKLHSEDESAIEWKDGFRLWYWHGTCVPQKLIKAPYSITREDIINEKNIEIRRCIMERMGSERFSEVLGLQEIDSDTDHQGNIQVLYKTKEKDDLTKTYLYFARVICPSTGRKYYLPVPRMRNVWDAVGYTFSKDKESYKPLIET